MNYNHMSFIVLMALSINNLHANDVQKPKSMWKKITDRIRSSSAKERIAAGAITTTGLIVTAVCLSIKKNKSNNPNNIFNNAPKCISFDIYYPDLVKSRKSTAIPEGRNYYLKNNELNYHGVERPSVDPKSDVTTKFAHHLVMFFYDKDYRVLYRHFEPCPNSDEDQIVQLRDTLVEQAKITLQN